ncbi:pyridoxal-phosphate dependent enzyme [Nocardia stercoris]|uniref:Pyridoxal-phosphate dependent enzyme n=2 Tax=Nocardia stercoris TaxID=2483361 RepID=A0A3M2KQU0_9NOCA|nr:pyridoxal-phosphate dependent enzyme [Nocardia stercoris]
MPSPTYDDVRTARERIRGAIRPLTVLPAPDLLPGTELWLACEFLQHTGSFKARGAVNLLAELTASRALPEVGIAAATGRNADLGFAWAAQRFDVPATVFLAAGTAARKVDRLRALGAEVRLLGDTQDEAATAAAEFCATTGAIDAYAYEDRAACAGAGTILLDLLDIRGDLDTIVVAVGAGGMFSGIAAVAHQHGVRLVGAEPVGSQALHTALARDAVTDVQIDSIAADSLGAPRISAAALEWARTAGARSVVVPDAALVAARRSLWDHHRIVVEHGSAAGLAALATGAYRPDPGERVGIVLCGANTDPADLCAG